MASFATLAALTAAHRRDSSGKGLEQSLYVFEVGSKGDDRRAQAHPPVDPGAAQEHLPLLPQMIEQAFVEGVGITRRGAVGEGHHGEVGRRTRIESG